MTDTRHTRLPEDPDADRVPMVPFVPWLCPRCRSGKPRTYAQHGRVRLHLCQACGRKFRSIELDPRDLKDPARLRELLGDWT